VASPFSKVLRRGISLVNNATGPTKQAKPCSPITLKGTPAVFSQRIISQIVIVLLHSKDLPEKDMIAGISLISCRMPGFFEVAKPNRLKFTFALIFI
jgi:hypothetical protein